MLTIHLQTTSLGHAYGMCVIFVTFLSTCMASLVALIIWRIHFLIVLFVFLVFILLDGAYLSAAFFKVPDGAWFALVLSFVMSSVFILWRWGKEQQWVAEAEDPVEPEDLLYWSNRESRPNNSTDGNIPMQITPAFGGGSLTQVPGLGIFFDKVGGSGDSIPKVFSQFVRKFKSRPEVVVFFHMRSLCQPSVPPDQRFVISRVTHRIPSCYRIALRHGYMDDVLTPDLAQKIIGALMMYITRGSLEENDEMSPEVREEMMTLRDAQEAQTVYLMGKQTMRIQRRPRDFLRRLGLGAFLWIRENSRTKVANLDIDPDNLVEVGFVKEI